MFLKMLAILRKGDMSWMHELLQHENIRRSLVAAINKRMRRVAVGLWMKSWNYPGPFNDVYAS